MAAPEGFEGTFVAVTFVPQYVAAGVVGVQSGHLLDEYVPDPDLYDEPGRPETMWAIIAVMSFTTPLLLVLGRRLLFSPSADGAARGVASAYAKVSRSESELSSPPAFVIAEASEGSIAERSEGADADADAPPSRARNGRTERST